MDIQSKSEKFKNYWNDYLKINPTIVLDDTWPSVGVVDLLTFSTRYKSDLHSTLHELLDGSSAYLGNLVATVWSSAGAEVEVSEQAISEGGGGIVLRASGGEILGTHSLEVEIERLFKERIAKLPNPFPVTNEYSVPIHFESQIVPVFLLGVLYGIAPGMTVGFTEIHERQKQAWAAAVTRVLARQSAEHYERLYPSEPLGQLAELYLNDLIFPPMLMSEELPLLGAMPKVLEYFSEIQVGQQQVLALGQNLALSPDYTLSNFGIALCGALSEKVPPAKVVAAARARGSYVGFLRRAMMMVRKHFVNQDDWILKGLKNDEMLVQFAIERVMKFVPWLTINKERLKLDKDFNLLTSLVAPVADFALEDAIKVCDTLLAELPEDIDLHTQRIKLELESGQAESSEAMFRKLLSEPNLEGNADFFNLWGNFCLTQNENEMALKYFKAAMNSASIDRLLFPIVANNAAWASMLCGNYVDALDFLERGLQKTVYPVTMLLNKSSILWDLARFDEALKVRELLFNVSPCDRRVFANLTLTEDLLAEALN